MFNRGVGTGCDQHGGKLSHPGLRQPGQGKPTRGDRHDHNGTSDHRPPPRSLANEEQDPERIQDGFNHGNKNSPDSADAFNGHGIEDEREADLQYASEPQGHPAYSSRKRLEHKRGISHGGHEVAQQHGFQRRFVLLLTQTQDNPGKGYPTTHGTDIDMRDHI